MVESVSRPRGRMMGRGWFSRERALALVLAAMTALAVYLCYIIAYPFLPSMAWALALAIIAHPLHAQIASRVQREGLAAAISVALITFVIVGPTLLVTQQLAQQAAQGLQQAQKMPTSMQALAKRHPRLAPAVKWVQQRMDVPAEAQQLAKNVASRVPGFVSGSFWIAAQLLITLFVLFFFLRDRRSAVGYVRSLMPLSNSETNEMFGRIADTIYATVYGTVVVALVQGTLGGLMFWWLGLPLPLLWGAVMALLAIVPVLGAFVVWVPAAIFLALSGNWVKALILAAWGGIVISMVDNLLYPILVGKRLRMHTLPVFLAIVGGLHAFGAAGLILGPVVLAVTDGLFDIWRRRTAGGRPAEAGISR